jgi:hypothetical protein
MRFSEETYESSEKSLVSREEIFTSLPYSPAARLDAADQHSYVDDVVVAAGGGGGGRGGVHPAENTSYQGTALFAVNGQAL